MQNPLPLTNRLALRSVAAGCAILLSLSSHLLAQEALIAPTPAAPPQARMDQNGNALPPDNEATTERVFVTGSAIPTAAEVGPNPVINVTRDLIEKSGERTAEELLRNLPIANGVPVSNNENGSNTAVGAATIALRGFDARATLILLDGRRVAPYPTSNAGIVFIDINSNPAGVDLKHRNPEGWRVHHLTVPMRLPAW